MEYTAKDASKIYDMNRETLRYYEKIGIIHPRIDATNHYRYYDDWDINYLGECKKYRLFGLSLNEILDIFSKDTLNLFIDRMKNNQERIEQQLTFLSMLSEYNQAYIQRLERIPKYLNRIELTDMEDQFFIPQREEFSYILSESLLEIIPELMESYAFIENAVYVPIDSYFKKNGNFFWGFSITSYWAEKLEIPTDKMTYLPQKQALYTIIDAGERGGFSLELFDALYHYAQNNKYKIIGPIIGFLLTRVNESDGYHRFIEVWLPVEKD